MNRKLFRWLVSIAFLFFFASAYAGPPNVVIILADDMGWGDVGYHGGRIETPNIDQLAREGVRQENLHVNPLCSPTWAGLMTGRRPFAMEWVSLVSIQMEETAHA